MQTIHITDVGEVTLRKSKRARRVILKVDPQTGPVITVPYYVPYAVAKRFANKHTQWFKAHAMSHTVPQLQPNQTIGREHQLLFIPTTGQVITSRITQGKIRLSYPQQLAANDPILQAEARKASTRALRKEAEYYLPARLYELAQANGYTYQEVHIKAMKTRWGSCSSAGSINLSLWLMQLPEELIEYVLCHELVHLHHQHHQAEFWQELASLLPDYTRRRATLKHYNPYFATQA